MLKFYNNWITYAETHGHLILNISKDYWVGFQEFIILLNKIWNEHMCDVKFVSNSLLILFRLDNEKLAGEYSQKIFLVKIQAY